MKAFVIIEIAICIIMAILVMTQIVLPAIKGRPLFPLLREKVRSSEDDLVTAREDVDVAQNRREAANLRITKEPEYADFTGQSDSSSNPNRSGPPRRRPQR